MDSNTIWVIIFAVLMLPGLLGVFLPIVPGIPLMFLLALVFGFTDSFQHLTSQNILTLLVLTVASVLVDYLSGTLGAKYSGASSKALGAGLIGMILGTLLFPPFGGILGLFAGVILVELRNGSREKALRAATGSLVGALIGIAINVVLAITFITLFVLYSLN